MEQNYKGKVMIHSLEELSPEQRRQLRMASRGIGCLALLVVVLAFLCFGSFPSTDGPLLFCCIDWVLFFAIPLGAFGFGASFGFELMLSDLGYAFSFGSYNGSDPSSLNKISSQKSQNYHRSNHYGSSVSINPSSGRPMSGSSGMDISGNPYGTRSW